MEEASVYSDFVGFLADLVNRLGLEPASGELMIVSFLGLLLLLLILVSARYIIGGRDARMQAAGLDSLQGIIGRFERLENTLNVFKTEHLRSAELTRMELQELRRLTMQVREALNVTHDPDDIILEPMASSEDLEKIAKAEEAAIEAEVAKEAEEAEAEKKSLV